MSGKKVRNEMKRMQAEVGIAVVENILKCLVWRMSEILHELN